MAKPVQDLTGETTGDLLEGVQAFSAQKAF